jgi:hypothetical protein
VISISTVTVPQPQDQRIGWRVAAAMRLLRLIGIRSDEIVIFFNSL